MMTRTYEQTGKRNMDGRLKHFRSKNKAFRFSFSVELPSYHQARAPIGSAKLHGASTKARSQCTGHDV